MPQHLPDHEAARGSRLVVRVALIVLAVSLVMQAKYYTEDAFGIVAMTWVSIAVQIAGMVLHRVTGSHKVGAHMLLLAIWALFFGVSAASGGSESPNLVANFVIVVMAPMLLGRRHGLIWLGVVLLTYVVQFTLASRGMAQHTIPADHLAVTRLTEFVVTSITVGLTAYFFAKGQERMRAAVAHEKHTVDVVNADLRVILDNSGQGFLSLDAKGRVTGERSVVIDSWLKDARAGIAFADLIRPIDPLVSESFAAGWSQLEADVLPLELCLDQLPKQLMLGETTLRLDYRPVTAEGNQIEKLVVIISDISAEVTRAEAETRQRDLLEAFERILRDPHGFALFLKTARRDVHAIVTGELEGGALQRCLHTLKGNSAVMGLSALMRACHQLEGVLADEGAPNPSALRTLQHELAAVEARLGSFVAVSTSDVQLRGDEYEAFLADLTARRPHSELSRVARTWSEARVDRHFARLGDYARELAGRLSRGHVELQTTGGALRMSDDYSDFWDVAVHVIRNAVDHGIEAPEEREALGKGPGTIRLEARVASGRAIIEVADDGRGIDWDRIREQARARKLPAESERDLLDAILADGLSTSESVSEISGRGVGMGSVRKVCSNLGIAIEVDSAPGLGTVFRFTFPECVASSRATRAASQSA
jgi:two-component system chemotaxis sensor kinase CheA